MAVKFFGQYLIEQNVITHAELLEAIKLQESTNRKIGEVVLEMELMSSTDIARVHLAQRSDDARFGDLAVQMGLISEENLQKALIKQRNSHLYIGEALVKTGALAEAELEDLLARFKDDQQPYLVDKVEIPANISNRTMWEMVADLTYKMLSRVANLAIRPGECQLIQKMPSRTMVAEIGFSGHISARYLLSIAPHSRQVIARAILQEDDVENESGEVLDDSVMEFINIICGNIAAKAAQFGYQVEINPPGLNQEAEAGIDVPAGHTGLMFPIYLSDGEVLELAIFISNESA